MESWPVVGGIGQDVGQGSRRRVDWDTEAARRNASELLARAQSSALGEAVAWLTTWRAAHPGEVPAAELLADAAAAGIATKTLHRARKQLGLRTRQTAGAWVIF